MTNTPESIRNICTDGRLRVLGGQLLSAALVFAIFTAVGLVAGGGVLAALTHALIVGLVVFGVEYAFSRLVFRCPA
jgi:hypothetical protein